MPLCRKSFVTLAGKIPPPSTRQQGKTTRFHKGPEAKIFILKHSIRVITLVKVQSVNFCLCLFNCALKVLGLNVIQVHQKYVKSSQNDFNHSQKLRS